MKSYARVSYGWELAPDEKRREHIIKQDLRFCAAMRRAHFATAPCPPAALPPAPVPMVLTVSPRDWLIPAALPSPIDRVSEDPLYPAWKRILAEVAIEHKVSVKDIISQRRDRAILPARYKAIYRMKTETTMSLPAIGRRIGGRDHTTIINALRKYQLSMGVAEVGHP